MGRARQPQPSPFLDNQYQAVNSSSCSRASTDEMRSISVDLNRSSPSEPRRPMATFCASVLLLALTKLVVVTAKYLNLLSDIVFSFLVCWIMDCYIFYSILQVVCKFCCHIFHIWAIFILVRTHNYTWLVIHFGPSHFKISSYVCSVL